MQNLQILTNNHLGTSFWEQRIGFISSIELNPLNINTFDELIDSDSSFILIDFYFSKLPIESELKMIEKLKEHAKIFPGYLKLFILSPTFSDTTLNYIQYENKVVVSDNFTNYFLKTLTKAAKIETINKSLLKSM